MEEMINKVLHNLGVIKETFVNYLIDMLEKPDEAEKFDYIRKICDTLQEAQEIIFKQNEEIKKLKEKQTHNGLQETR